MPLPTKPALLLALAFTTVPLLADDVYVVTSNAQFDVFDLSSGSFTAIGPELPEASSGLVAGPNGSLLTLTISGKLDTINPTNGKVTASVPTGLGSCTGAGSGQCGPNAANNIAELNGSLYATDYSNNLYKLNPITGAKTLVGSTGVPPVYPLVPYSPNAQGQLPFFGEALVGAKGSLYATFFTGTLDPNTFEPTPVTPDHLYQIDPVTGATVNLDPNSPTTFGIDTIVEVNGMDYAFANAFSELDTINLSNGVTTTVGSFDPGSTGLILGAVETPEPSAIALAALGLVLLLSLRRVRREARWKRLAMFSTFILGIVCIPAHAESVAVTYSLSGTGTVVGSTDTALTLDAQASGLIVSGDPGRNSAWNPVSYTDESVLDLTTNLLNGNFRITLQDGDTLTGTVFEDDTAIDNSPTQTGAFPQTLTFTGGTGEFSGATGSVSGIGYLGTTNFAVSGSGTINTAAVPEPAPAALVVGGLGLLIGVGGSRRVKLAFKLN